MLISIKSGGRQRPACFGGKRTVMNSEKTDSTELIYGRGDVILREGETGETMYQLRSGSAVVYSRYGEPDQKALTELHAGDWFGELAAFGAVPRSATIVAAEEDTRAEAVDTSDLRGYFSVHTGELEGILRHLSGRLRELTEEYTAACDALRELKHSNKPGNRVETGLFARIRRFARVYLLRNRETELEQPQRVRPEPQDRDLALHSGIFDAGEVIFRERTASECMYYIHGGRVGIYTDYGTAHERLLTELTPELFFGEMGLFEKTARSATAVALEDGTFLEMIYVRDIGTLYEKNPALVLAMLEHLANRLREMTRDYLQTCKALSEACDGIGEPDLILTEEAGARPKKRTR